MAPGAVAFSVVARCLVVKKSSVGTIVVLSGITISNPDNSSFPPEASVVWPGVSGRVSTGSGESLWVRSKIFSAVVISEKFFNLVRVIISDGVVCTEVVSNSPDMSGF